MAIEITKLTHIYSLQSGFQQTALSDVSIKIETGEFIGIAGHTGSGKSTLIQHMIGLLKPTEGTIKVDGINIHDAPKNLVLVRRKIGMVFQYPEHQLFEETVEADVAFGPKNIGLSEEETKERVRKALKLVGLDYSSYADRSPFHLSGGQMRRVAIAGVLALNPEFLVLDEPTAGLDPQGRREILSAIKKLHVEENLGVILISHNMDDLALFSERIIVLNHGKVVQDLPPDQLFNEHVSLLKDSGLDLPILTQISQKLAKKGFKFDRSKKDIRLIAEDIFNEISGGENNVK